MKKTILLLISLILVGTCVFASFSFTKGFGYGITDLKSPGYFVQPSIGPSIFTSFDIVGKRGFSFYFDNVFNYNHGFFDVWEGGYRSWTKDYIPLTIDAGLGCGYSFDLNKVLLSVGAGVNFKAVVFVEYKEFAGGAFVGEINTRVKATYRFNNIVGLSAIVSPSFPVFFTDLQYGDPDWQKGFSGYANVGLTLTF